MLLKQAGETVIDMVIVDKTLCINVPNTWVLCRMPTDKGVGYYLTTEIGEIIQISVFPYGISADKLKKSVEAMATEESKLPYITVDDIQPNGSCHSDGFHYRAEDTRYTLKKTPPGEYRYIARGVRELDGMFVVFSVLTNSAAKDTIDRAIRAIVSITKK